MTKFLLLCQCRLCVLEVYLNYESQVCHIVLFCLNELLQYIPGKIQIREVYSYGPEFI